MAISIGDALLKLGVDKSDLDKGMREAEQQIDQSAKKMTANFTAVTASLAVLSAAGLKISADAREMSAALAGTAITLGVSAETMRQLALATTDVTFPLKSVLATFELLARAGVESTAQMKATAGAFDALADAIGSSAEAVADMLLPAYKAFGETLPSTAGQMDKFTWLVRNTTVNLDDFGRMMTYLAPDMDRLNVSMDDAIAILAALEARGITGAAATRELRKAVTEAITEHKDLTTVLGLTTDELTRYNDKLKDSVGLTQKYAEAAEKQVGIMDRVKQEYQKMTLATGEALTPLEPLMAGITGLSVAMLAVNTIAPAFGTALVSALGPIVGLGAGIAMVALGLNEIEKAEIGYQKQLDLGMKLDLEYQKALEGRGNIYYELLQQSTNLTEADKIFLSVMSEAMKGIQVESGVTLAIIEEDFEVGNQLIHEANERLEAMNARLDATIARQRATAESFFFVLNTQRALAEYEQEQKARNRPFVWGGPGPYLPGQPTPVQELQGGGLVSKPTLALLGERGPEMVTPVGAAFRTANIFIELDGTAIARAVGQPLVDEIRIRQGLKL